MKQTRVLCPPYVDVRQSRLSVLVLHFLCFDNTTRAKNKINPNALLVPCHSSNNRLEHNVKHRRRRRVCGPIVVRYLSRAMNKSCWRVNADVGGGGSTQCVVCKIEKKIAVTKRGKPQKATQMCFLCNLGGGGVR